MIIISELNSHSISSRSVSMVLLMFILSSFVSSCSPANPSVDNQKVRQEVAEVFRQYTETVNSGVTRNIPTYFSDDKRFYWVEDGLKIYGDKKAMVASLDRFTKDVSEVSMQTDELIITPISNEVASLFTSYNQRLLFANGFELLLEGAITITVIKEDNTWKFLNGHSSTKKPRGN